MIGIVMAPPPRGVPLSPVSIAALPALGQLRKACRDRGDRFVDLAGPEDAEKLEVVLWDFGSIAVKPSWLRSSTRTIAWSLESPLVAHRAYHRLPEIACSSDAVLGFPGVRDLLKGFEDRFTPIHWPVSGSPQKSLEGWAERPFATMINSNKNVHSLRGQLTLHDPYRSARRIAAAGLASTYGLRGTWQAPNLYRQRLNAIETFAVDEGFDLWGVGWDRPVAGSSRGQRAAVRSSYRGRAHDKVDTLARYRFGLCIENTRFPGYISEKLFDALYAGTIPVYLGAPDVADYVPEDAYVAVDRFEDLESLRAFLAAMEVREAERLLSAGQAFLGSPSFKRFGEGRFVASFMDVIDGLKIAAG